MAHEQIIRNGLIVDKKFSFLDNPTVYVSGITQSGPLVDRNHIVTESVIKTKFDTLTLDDLSGVNFSSASNNDILVFNGSEWVATGMSSIAGDFYTKAESDLRFLNLDGTVAMTGNLDMGGNAITNVGNVDGVDVSTLKTDHDTLQTNYNTFVGTTYANRTLGDINDVTLTAVATDDFIRWNGTAWVNVATTTILSNYYTKSEADTNFIDAAGDTMTGNLTLNGGNIIMTGFETVDGVDISVFKTDFDTRSLTGNTDVTFSTTPTNEQLLQFNGTDWVNVDASSVVTDSYTKTEADNRFVDVAGDSMTGELIINVGGIGNRALSTTGDAYITGNLYVSGVTTTINTENMAISDNLLLLNSGETGAGVSNHTAGFLVDRGTISAVTLIFDEDTFTIRVGETPSTLIDNDVDISHTVALATISDAKNFGTPTNYGMLYWTNDVLQGGILNNSTTITFDSGDLHLNGGNITMEGTETVDGVDISVFKTNYDAFVGTTYINRTLGQISDVDVTGAATDDILSYNATSGHWELTTVGSLAGDFYTKSESDTRFVNVDGDIMTGNLTVPSLTATTLVLNGVTINNIYDEDDMNSDSDTALATQQSIKAYVDTTVSNIDLSELNDVTITSIATDDFIRWNGSAWVNVATTTILNDYYTKSEADTNFVDVAGDTMTGDLNMGVNNITFTTGLVDGVDVSQLKTDHDTLQTNFTNRVLGGVSDVTLTAVADKDVLYYDNASSEWINGDFDTLMTGTYVNVAGDTMTGDLTITPLAGTGNRLVYVDDAGKLQESDEYVFKTSTTGLGNPGGTIETFSASKSKGVTWDYVITDGTNMRAGTVTAVWDGTNVEYNEVSTNDLGDTSGFEFGVSLSGGNISLVSTITSGTWSVDTNRQLI